MPSDRLARRALNRALLARQLLLSRAAMSTLEAVEHLVGLQSQAPLAHYVGLWSRLDPFDPVPAGAALERGDLVRTHAMRATVHLLTRRDAVALRSLTQPMLASRFGSSPFFKQLPGVDLDAVCRAAHDLTTRTPMTRVELGRALAAQFPGVAEDALAYAATYRVPAVQVPPRGVWGKRGPARWQTFAGGSAPKPTPRAHRRCGAALPGGLRTGLSLRHARLVRTARAARSLRAVASTVAGLPRRARP